MPDEPSVTPDPNLPAELQGKTPGEIAAFYQQRERQLRAQMDERNTPPAATPPAPALAVEPSAAEFWTDPIGTVKKTTVSREEFNTAAIAVQRSLVKVAKMAIQQAHADWPRWSKDIENLMSTYPLHLQADEQQWETAYVYIKGLNFDKEAALRPAGSSGGEAPSPSPTPAPKPEELSREQANVVDRMGLSKEKYFKARDGLASGNWPGMTFDTRKGRS
jgi:hypothetical protein